MFAGKKRVKLLVADDSETFRSLLSYMLSRRKFIVEEASNGREALDKICKNKPDIIILDVMMPEMNGIELCKRLRENKETRDIPVIFCTAANMEGIFDKEVIFDDYVEKPFSIDKLCEKIDRLVKQIPPRRYQDRH